MAVNEEHSNQEENLLEKAITKEALVNMDESGYKDCGLGPFRPTCLKKRRNVLSFTIVVSIMLIIQGGAVTYLNASLTTLEKAFKITSAKSGFITSANDIGFLCFVVLASYLASRSHKPLVIGISNIIVGFSGIFCALPYFIFGGSMEDISTNDRETFPISYNSSSQNVSIFNVSNIDAESCDIKQSNEADFRGTASYGMMIFGQVVDGIASSPRWSLTMSFIDENVNLYAAPFYLGILFSLRTLSPVVGYGFGAIFTLIPIDLKEHDISPYHPQWISAWWLGFLVIGIAVVTSSIPILFFPKHLPVEASKPKKKKSKLMMILCSSGEAETPAINAENDIDSSPALLTTKSETEHINIKGFPKALWRLFSNPIFILKLVIGFFNALYYMGFHAFLPKYLERQFELTASQASLIVGITAGIPTAVGTILSGYFTKRMKLTLIQMGKVEFFIFLVASVIFTASIGISCPKSPVHGVNSDESINMSEPCNIDLNCPKLTYNPVCSVSTGETFFSPCQAGCRSSPIDKTYYNCTCIPDGIVTQGVCKSDCKMIYAFSALLMVSTFIIALGLMPSIMILMRGVEPRDKALCIGVYTCFVSLLGIISPVMFGSVIDSFCFLHDACNKDVCLIYDMTDFRLKYLGMAHSFRLPQLVFIGVLWYVFEKRYKGIVQVGLDKEKVADNKDNEPEKELLPMSNM
ncbi:solute carrier organic anion transporter family member 1B1-like [Tubulanus polymorphus]|uniref:solute carrier organic anion transporter family member 1B1-like n=1 Tax=Tubulanus polymorphus TaxID=672921 RepID=UPI003DA60196